MEVVTEVIVLDKVAVYRDIREVESHPCVAGQTLVVESDYPWEVDLLIFYRRELIKITTIGYN